MAIKILAEASVPYLRGVLEELGEVTYLPSEDFTKEAVKDKDWLLVRSITKCNQALLEGSAVQLISSATIGFDHIDTDYCETHGIAWTNAPGCNAEAVGQYLACTWAWLEQRGIFQFRGKTIGIVGVGHVGTVVERYAKAWGMRVLRNDPPRAEQEGTNGFVSLEEIYKASDIISFHTPLSKKGKYPSYHLFSKGSLASLARRPLIINACRGAVTETEAMLQGLEEKRIAGLIIDCWEGEPHPSTELLSKVLVASPHIAGFSADGKSNGARACVEAGCRHFGLRSSQLSQMTPSAPDDDRIILSPNDPHPLATAMLKTLDIAAVDEHLRTSRMPFEEQRRSYQFPREPHAYTVHLPQELHRHANALKQIGFQVKLLP